MIRVCQRYFDDPDELNAIFDYAVILLERTRKIKRRGFGFNLMLGLAPSPENCATAADEEEQDALQGRSLYVSGYLPEVFSPLPPSRTEGKCLVAGQHQLQYLAEALPGISGGPVWLGFRGGETVVAIQ